MQYSLVRRSITATASTSMTGPSCQTRQLELCCGMREEWPQHRASIGSKLCDEGGHIGGMRRALRQQRVHVETVSGAVPRTVIDAVPAYPSANRFVTTDLSICERSTWRLVPTAR